MKRTLTAVLFVILCLAFAGCGTLLDGTYESVTASEDEMPIKEGSTLIVSSYQSLRNAILELVDTYGTEETLTFTGYTGDIAEDLPRVCAELKAENPLCAYAVDYISYDLNRIVSYYEAQIYINYSRTPEELAALHSIVSVANAPDALRAAIKAGEENLCFSAVGNALTTEAVQSVADAGYYDAPLQFISRPRVSLSVYPNTGISRIYAVHFDYGAAPEQRAEQLSALRQAVAAIIAQLDGSDMDRAAQAAALLSERCTRTRDTLLENLTAYAALVGGRANAEGVAMAYKALCDEAGIPCLVISGRMDKRSHAWNMIELDGNYYHVDVSRLTEEGSVLLHTDSDMRSEYWWDIDLYPASVDVLPAFETEEDTDAEEAPDAGEVSDAEEIPDTETDAE